VSWKDADEFNGGGWKAIGVFANQGECVSFAAAAAGVLLASVPATDLTASRVNGPSESRRPSSRRRVDAQDVAPRGRSTRSEVRRSRH